MLNDPCNGALQNSSSDVDKILVGNKCDLESKRVIPYSRGEEVSPESHKHSAAI